VTQRTSTILFVALLVLSVVAPFAAPAAAASGAPDGMVGVPSDQISSDLPPQTPMGQVAERLEGEVQASAHASTLDVVVTNPGRAKKYTDGTVVGGGPVAIVLRDEIHHAGRDVALPADVLRDTLGYVPNAAYGTHEDGEPWTRQTRAEDGSVIFEVPHFSANTVTFAGEVNLTGSPATNGTTYEYNLSELDAASDPVVNLTGVTRTEWENTSATRVSPTATHSLNPAGNADPGGPGGSPTLTVTNTSAAYNPVDVQGTGVTDYRITFVGDGGFNTKAKAEAMIRTKEDRTTTKIAPYVDELEGSAYDANVDIYVIEEQPDETYGEGTLVKSDWTPDWSTGRQTITLDQSVTFEAGVNHTIEFVTTNSNQNDAREVLQLGLDDSGAPTDWFAYDQNGGSAFENYPDINIGEAGSVSSLSVSDGAGHSLSFGDFAPGETKTLDWSTLSRDATALDFSGSGGGTLEYTLEMQERTQTEDAGVELNGNTTTHTGTLGDGNTTTLTLEQASLREGTNDLNVTVGDGTLSADAPTPAVGLEYVHDAKAKKSVAYTGEKFSERYNVSHTYASARDPATLTIPFAGEVIGIRSVEKRVGGGSWQAVATSAYTLDGTTMTVDLGSISENTTVEVRAVGSKVNPIDMGIEVLEPTAPGQRLDTKISVPSVTAAGSPKLELPNQRLTYAYNESWSANERAVFSGESQTLHLDEIGAGSTFRASTIPVTVEPDGGDVAIEVPSPTRSEPEFVVAPGPGGLDADVTYTFLEATDGGDYSLYSRTSGLVRDQGTASSPLSLTDDDSEETLVFLLEESSTSTSDNPTGVFGGDTNVGGSDPWNSLPAILVAFAVVEIALFWADRRIGSPGTTGVTFPVVGTRVGLPGGGFLFWAGTAVTVVVGLEFASGGAVWAALAAGLQRALNEQGEFLIVVGAAIAAYYAYKKISSDDGPKFTINARRGK